MIAELCLFVTFQLSQGHRVVILQVMERIIKENLDSVDPSLSVDLIKQASEELTQSKVQTLGLLFLPYSGFSPTTVLSFVIPQIILEYSIRHQSKKYINKFLSSRSERNAGGVLPI